MEIAYTIISETCLFHSLQFSSKLPETWHIYVKYPAQTVTISDFENSSEKKSYDVKISPLMEIAKKLSPKLGKLF